MTGDVTILPFTPEHHSAVARVADSLPEWFTEHGRAMIRADMAFQRGLVAVDATGACVGFVLFYAAEGVGHIGWMGVVRARHRSGVGRLLIREVEDELARAGVEYLDVFTLGDGVDYPPYALTRAFYRALGFVTHRRETHDNPECPESVVLRKPLRRT